MVEGTRFSESKNRFAELRILSLKKMLGSSTVGEMHGSSTVRDFKSYPLIKIVIPNTEKFKMIVFKGEEAKEG